MNNTAMIVTAVLLAAAPPALADDPPMRKAGEWELKSTSGAIALPTQKVCAATDRSVADFANVRMGKCNFQNVGVSGKIVTVDMTCAGPANMSMVIHSVITVTGQDAYHSQGHIHFDKAPAGLPADMDVANDARWLGPTCQPGDRKEP